MDTFESQVERSFSRIERRSERVLAALRLLAILVLGVVFRYVGAIDQGQPNMIPLAGLVLIAIATLWLTGRRTFRPWVLWVFATLDVGLLTHCLLMLAEQGGQSWQLALDTPLALLIFVFLAATAVRHRPYLILYTGGLFIANWVALWLWSWHVDNGVWQPGVLTADMARLTVVALTSYTLFVAVKRARRGMTRAIAETHMRENLSRFFSPQVLEEIAQSGNPAASFRSHKVAILFSDLRGFTAMAENMGTQQVAGFLSDYRRRIAGPIGRHGGTIDKFIGDGVMAIFGVPEPRPADARNAVLAGMELVAAIDAWCGERLAQGLPPVEIGIGIHYGEVIAGALGDEQRLEYTVIGDAVNAAARIERLAADMGASLLVSDDVLQAAPGLAQELALEAPFTHRLRGRTQPIQLYRLASEASAQQKRISLAG